MLFRSTLNNLQYVNQDDYNNIKDGYILKTDINNLELVDSNVINNINLNLDLLTSNNIQQSIINFITANDIDNLNNIVNQLSTILSSANKRITDIENILIEHNLF